MFKVTSFKVNLDKLWGYGTYTYQDGSYFEGQFLNGYLHGQGTCYIPGQKVQPCEFKDGKNITKGNSPGAKILGNLIKRAIIGAILD